MEYFYMAISTLGMVGNFMLQKVYQNRYCKNTKDLLLLPLLRGVFSVIIYVAILGFTFKFSGFTAIMALIFALCNSYNTVIGLVIMKQCSMATFSMFIMIGGMLLPFLAGIIFLGESLTVFNVIAMVLLLLGIFAIYAQKGKFKMTKLGTILCISVFFVNGCTSITSKFHQININALSSMDFASWIAVWIVVIMGLLYIGYSLYSLKRKKQEEKTQEDKPLVEKKPIDKKALVLSMAIMFALGAITCITNVCQFKGASTIPASVIYPVNTGGTIVLLTLFGAVCYKEKLNKASIIGVSLGLIATILFAL